DLHFVREERQAGVGPSQGHTDSAARRKKQELRLVRTADLTLVVSPTEKLLLERECGSEVVVRIMPTIYPMEMAEPPGWHNRTDIVFIGGFAHVPNIDAVLFFTREIFPLILTRIPNAAFRVVGPDPPAEIRALASPNVHI